MSAAPAAAVPSPEAEAPPRRSRLPLILGAALALLGAGGGYLAVATGLTGLGGGAEASEEAHGEAHGGGHGGGHGAAEVAFVALPPLVVNLPGGDGRFLRFAAQVEVAPAHLEEVALLTPRIVDVLNGYLRAVELADIEDPAALLRLRAQMLRRVQVVTGADRARDLLVMEFVIN